jgi:hypothetical protein
MLFQSFRTAPLLPLGEEDGGESGVTKIPLTASSPPIVAGGNAFETPLLIFGSGHVLPRRSYGLKLALMATPTSVRRGLSIASDQGTVSGTRSQPT